VGIYPSCEEMFFHEIHGLVRDMRANSMSTHTYLLSPFDDVKIVLYNKTMINAFCINMPSFDVVFKHLI
jgi:hypothetical protein